MHFTPILDDKCVGSLVNITLPDGRGGLVRANNSLFGLLVAPAVLEAVPTEDNFPSGTDVAYVSPS